MKVEVARFNVRVHVVCPGRVETDFFSHESFRNRTHRPETARTITLDAVSRAIIDAVRRDRFLTYVPNYYGILAWAVAGLPVVFRPIWHRFLTARVESVYVGSDGAKPD